MAKHKYIESPEKMWDLFQAYRNKVKSTPIQKSEQRKGTVVIPKGFDGDLPDALIDLPIEKPLTIEGFENYVEDEGVITDLGKYFSNDKNAYDEFRTICKRIRRVIREDQITGGMAGIYNPSITQRLNGLVEKIQEDGTKSITVKVIRGDRHKTEQSASGATESEG
jgi:hypothetical protein